MNLFKKFPSFDYLLESTGSTFMRFPLTLLSAMMGTLVAVMLVESKSPSAESILQKLLLIAALGLPFFTATTIFAEKRKWRPKVSFGLQGIGVVLLLLYFLSLPQDITKEHVHLVRFVLLNIGLHFLVAFLPNLGGQQVRGFWQYNMSMFLRFLIAVLYSAVLYVGLVIALAALDYLFGVDVKDERYFELWVIMAGTVNTWIFLAGIPRNFEALDHSGEYPIGLKVFAQYILLPLVALYFIILITYEAKIILAWNWPKGWVSQLVLWYSVVGILSLLLLHPLRELGENKWIKVFGKWFFRALIPLVVMLFLAILRRISDYGITENRYFVIAMATGLGIVVLYFVFSKRKDIRVIPLVICCIAFLSAYGPWSAFAVSKRDQQHRLESILLENEILIDGAIQRAPTEVPHESRKEISSIVSYLKDWHGLGSFSVWYSDSVLNSLDTLNSLSTKEQITEMMGFAFIPRWERPDTGGYFHLATGEKKAVEIEGYTHLIDFEVYEWQERDIPFQVNDHFFHAGLDSAGAVLTLRMVNLSDSSTSEAKLNLDEYVNRLIAEYRNDQVPIEEMTFLLSSTAFDAKALVSVINGTQEDSVIHVDYVKADFLVRLR